MNDLSLGARTAIALHRTVYRWSGGRLGHHLGSLEQVLVTTTGRRTGAPRTTPLMLVETDDTLVLVASVGGGPRHPAWYLNLRDEPAVRVQRGRTRFPARARTATGEERARLWAAAVAANPTYATYQTRTEREIPVVVLERVRT